MQYFVILTTKGPAVFQRTSPAHGRVLFAGAEYAVPIEDASPGKESANNDDDFQSIIWSAIQVIQTQRFRKVANKKRKHIQVVNKNDRSAAGRLTTKNKSSVMEILLGAGLAKMFRSSFIKTKPTESNEYPEGEFSSYREVPKREKPMEPLLAFETADKGELFQCKFSIVLSEETDSQPLQTQMVHKKNLEYSSATGSILKGAQKNFYTGEFSFILGLAKSKVCIREVGNWLYNTEHTEIFSNLQNIIEMLIAVFINTVVRSLSKEYIDEDIDAYISKEVNDYSGIIYKSPARTEAIERILQKLQELSDKKLSNAAMETASLSMLVYFDKLSSVIYSSEFIKYIASVEENITKYKKRYSSEVMAAEEKFRCNLCFLFIDVYHRLIKYRLYITEAIDTLKKGSTDSQLLNEKEISNSLSDYDEQLESEKNIESGLFELELRSLSNHNSRLTELLKATERFKKIKALTSSGIAFPDCIDDFIESFELTNGLVLITRDNIVIVNGNNVIAIISKKEVFACIPACVNTEYPTTYIDLAVSSLYPLVSNFVVDIVDGTRVHWIRLNFKWDGNQRRFVEACKCKTVSTIQGLEMRLRSNTVSVDRTLRDRISRNDVKNSHKRMLAIKAQRDLVPTADIYTFGQKNRASECILFGIKAWIDSALQEYSVSLTSVSVIASKTVSFEKQLLREVNSMIKYHKGSVSPGTEGVNEFSPVLSDRYTLTAGVPVFIEYLSYIYRLLSPKDIFVYSTSAMCALSSVHEMRNPTLSNDEFLELAIGCSTSMTVPESLNRNEFLLSLLLVRFFTIAAPDIGLPNYLALCSPLFIFNSKDLIDLPKCTSD